MLQHGHAGGAHTALMVSFGRLILAQSGRGGFENGGAHGYSLVPPTQKPGGRVRSAHRYTAGRLRRGGILATLSPPSHPHTR